MANWFCSVFNGVCVVHVCLVHAADLNYLAQRGFSPSREKMHKRDEVLIVNGREIGDLFGSLTSF